MKAGKLLLIFFIIIMSWKNTEAFMFWNQACSFAGNSSSYVAVPNSASLNITGTFTVEAWVNPFNSTSPAAQIILEKRNGSLANGYALLLSNGRVAIRTNSVVRLVGNTIIPSKTWTHISGTYNASTNGFTVYVNGILDSSINIPGAQPVTNSDSVRIGKGNVNSPFKGTIDEIRIWRKALSQSEVSGTMRTTLGASSGLYSMLVLSLTFQDDDSEGPDFSLFDWSGNNNNGNNNGANAFDLSNRPSNTIALNESVELDGVDDYLFGSDNAAISPENGITLESWILARSTNSSRVIIQKGTTGGPGINYSLRLSGGILSAVINGNSSFNSGFVLQPNVWTHVSFTYNPSTGKYVFYINGGKIFQGTNAVGTINNSAENLYLGSAGMAGTNFHGFIDECRISNYVKSQLQIQRFLYQSIDSSNQPNPGFSNVVYNFDGYAYDNAGAGPVLNFVNEAAYSHPGTTDNQPVSPLNRADDIHYSDGFNLKTSLKRIPDAGFTGTILDTLCVNLDTIITDINVFVALNHSAEEELQLALISPGGQSVNLYMNNTLTQNSDNLITVFDDQADSNLSNSAEYVSFSPAVKPVNSLNSVFAGSQTKGKWKLLIKDVNGAGTGQLLSWGIQFDSAALKIPAMSVRVFMEGFYRPVDSCVFDTINIQLMEDFAPYKEVGLNAETPDDNYIIYTNFLNADFISNYYIKVTHRNSIETWSANPVSFDFLSGTIDYDFTLSDSSAYGNNEKQVDILPRFAMYGGDVNQNDLVDLNDITDVLNDASVFGAGYIVTDVTGDNLVDLTDLSITYNNSQNFVSAITP